MKNVIKTIVILLICGLSMNLKAEINNKLNVTIKEQNKIFVELSEFGDNYSIAISNKSGKNIYEANNLSIANLKFSVDLSNQEEGLYHLIIKNDEKMQTIPFTIGEDIVSLNKRDEKITYFPQIEENGNSVLVKMITNEVNDLEFDIMNDEGIRLYHEQIGGQIGMIGKRFRFKSGEYMLTFNSNDYQYNKVLRIK